MASSFEPLAGFAATAEADPPAPSRPWFEALATGNGFQPDPRFAEPTPPPPPEPAQAELDAVLADAIADAERRGREAALSEMASEGAARAALKLSFQRLDENLREQLSTRLAETVAALCEATLAPMALDGDSLQRRCRSAAAQLGEGIGDASLHLHPDDIDLLDADFAREWPIVPAPGQERGTVVFQMPEGIVRDGPAEWRAALREALGLC
ncbi:FliH/SctL family protein [Aurantiacibacter poecillastricola]|uniref:FliH/SctL family protein n=1 Tax=Aurantiacibacter poecillastricola TaxID=3064385 RepID=UPI00273F4F95|nr:flagellar biosynthesis protein [Aurantiacibacter sp. 219JJ12-13]MDP5263127.1 flagellar biosynthesis protein [Aurantiacibacter sp. 219JJ12-13]